MKKAKNSFIELFEKCSEDLKTLAFTHSSYAHDHGTQCNERIEFLGDSVLSTIVSDYLYKHYYYVEGKMSKIRASFVCTDSLAELAKQLGIESRILFGKSFKASTISNAVLADTIESMIGVMYLTYGMPSIANAVLEALQVKEKLTMGLTSKDYKSELQVYCQDQQKTIKYTAETYETKGGQTNFRASVFINNQFIAYGQGSTKREAEQNSARLALEKFKKQPEEKLN